MSDRTASVDHVAAQYSLTGDASPNLDCFEFSALPYIHYSR